MSKITEEEIQKILPVKGPSFEEVKNYLEKYNNEYIIIKCGGSVLVDQDLFNIHISVIKLLKIFLSTKTFPPYFTTIKSFLYLSIYLETSFIGGPFSGNIFSKSINLLLIPSTKLQF